MLPSKLFAYPVPIFEIAKIRHNFRPFRKAPLLSQPRAPPPKHQTPKHHHQSNKTKALNPPSRLLVVVVAVDIAKMRKQAGKVAACFLFASLVLIQFSFSWQMHLDTQNKEPEMMNIPALTNATKNILNDVSEETKAGDQRNKSSNKKIQELPIVGEEGKAGDARTSLNISTEVRDSLLNSNENTSGTTDKNEKLLFHFIFNGGQSQFQPFMLRAIESVFYHHPDAQVKIHSPQVTLTTKFGLPLLKPLFGKFDLQMEHYDLEKKVQSLKNHFKDTQLLQSFIDGLPNWIKTSRYREYNLSDVYRLILLYTRGGIYLDLDSIVVRPMNTLGDNVVGKQSEKSINGAVLKFQKGNIFLEKALHNMFNEFAPFSWGYQGPKLMTRTMRKDFRKCRWMEAGREGNHNSTVCPVDVMGVDAFYPLHYAETDNICYERSINDTTVQEWRKILETKTFVAHITGKKKKLVTQPGTLCRWLKNAFCVTKETCEMIV
jgi:hypothetical protein